MRNAKKGNFKVQDVMVIIGTRPEAIKMAPVMKALQARATGRTILCVTAQHREMLDQALDIFGLKPDIDMNLMTPGQDLAALSARVLTGVRDAIRTHKPEAVLVHGDTSTCLASALAAFYEQVPVGHVEAGLRTYDMAAPWPEEMHRRLVDPLCRWCFAPTQAAVENLHGERIAPERVFLTGNTAIDALQMAVARVRNEGTDSPFCLSPHFGDFSANALDGKRMVLVTGHRRENFGAGFESLCLGLRDIVEQNSDVVIVYPMHLNPSVRGPVTRLLGGHPRIYLLPPQPYLPFVWLLQKCVLVITDSGGIQEEAPSLGKPVLVMRESTERPEAVLVGIAILVGTDRKRIADEATRLLRDPQAYQEMAGIRNPFGDGKAAGRIVEILSRAIVGNNQ